MESAMPRTVIPCHHARRRSTARHLQYTVVKSRLLGSYDDGRMGETVKGPSLQIPLTELL
jgi:hypothetical protein